MRVRFADDKVILLLGKPHLEIEPFCLDRGGWLRGRPASRYPVSRAFVVHKGANETRLGDPVKAPLATWCEAVMTAPVPFWATEMSSTDASS